MEQIIHWPFEVYLAACASVASLFIARNDVNFGVVQMGVAILLVALFVIIAAHSSQAVTLFLKGRYPRKP